jgi:hypothetical protein
MSLSFPPLPPHAAPQFSFARLVIAASILTVCLCAGIALALYCVALNQAHGHQQETVVAPASTISRPAPPEPEPTALSPEEQSEIEKAVVRGVRWLKARQHPDGHWDYPSGYTFGAAALAGLTLLECGVPPSDPNVQATANFLRRAVNGTSATYDLSLGVLFFDRLHSGDQEPTDRPLIRTMAVRLIAAQRSTGGWEYACPLLQPNAIKQLEVALKEAERQSAFSTSALPPPPEKWHHEVVNLPSVHQLVASQDRFRAFEGDNSNTQFAVLALWVARRHGVAVERSAYLFTERFRHSQHSDGHWGYRAGEAAPISPGTTAAGLLGLAVGRGVALERSGTALPLELDPLVQKAFAYLGKVIPVRPAAAPGSKRGPVPMANLYVLWSLERVAVLYRLERIDGKDWYVWARDVLLTNQKDDGRWEGGLYPAAAPLPDTCFALLTLLRANLAKDLTTKLQLLGEKK